MILNQGMREVKPRDRERVFNDFFALACKKMSDWSRREYGIMRHMSRKLPMYVYDGKTLFFFTTEDKWENIDIHVVNLDPAVSARATKALHVLLRKLHIDKVRSKIESNPALEKIFFKRGARLIKREDGLTFVELKTGG